MDAKNMWDDMIINVTRPSMPQFDEYIEAIKPLWESHWLTNMGVYHAELEEQLKDYLNVSGLSLMVNGHMALELAIQMMEFPEGGRSDHHSVYICINNTCNSA